MIKDKKTGLEMPENDKERLWFNLREKLKMEVEQMKESIKPKNRMAELKKIKELIAMNEELIKTCEKKLK